MMTSIQRLYYALVKPRSNYLSDLRSPFPSDRKRIADVEKGEHHGIAYRLETAVNERESPLSIDYVSRRSIQGIVKEQGYDVGANLAEMAAIRERKRESSLRQWLDQASRKGVIDHILTRPSYRTETKRTYLILIGLSQEDLEEVRLKEAAKSREHETLYRMALHNPSYTGTSLEIFFLGLVEERFRKTAERQARENQSNPECHGPYYDWQLSPERLIPHLVTMSNTTFVHSYHLVNGKAVPVLEVKDFKQGHEAAKDCIDFALNDGQAILEDRICLVRHRPHLIDRLNVNLVDHILDLPWTRDFYVEIAMEHQIHEDIQVAPFFGKLANGDLEALAERLVPEVLRLSYSNSQNGDGDQRVAVVSFNGYPREGDRILCFSSRRSLSEYNQSRKDRVRVVADARSPSGKDVGDDFSKLLYDLYRTDRRKWFEYFKVPEEKWKNYPNEE